MQNNKCKICRRSGIKLFLKGERCFSPKCAIIKRPYAPGQKAKKRRRNISEFGKELKEKQKLKNWYNLNEKQFSSYVKEVLNKGSETIDAGTALLAKLESRFDNVIFQAGFASSRSQARQLVGHGFFMLNGRKVNVPSVNIKKGDKITLHSKVTKKKSFTNLSTYLKKHKAPSWIRVNTEKSEIEIIGQPGLEDTASPAELSSIFEFYSK